MRAISMVLLTAAWIFNTGASLEGVREVREWKHAGDLASALNQPLVAYPFYERVAKALPGTRHGNLAAGRARTTRGKLLAPPAQPTSEDPSTFIGEVLDFLIWP